MEEKIYSIISEFCQTRRRNNKAPFSMRNICLLDALKNNKIIEVDGMTALKELLKIGRVKEYLGANYIFYYIDKF
jgi:hypothetical protein